MYRICDYLHSFNKVFYKNLWNLIKQKFYVAKQLLVANNSLQSKIN